MRIIAYLLIGFLSIATNGNAQSRKAENSLLWEISGNGLKKSSYLFGTYHFADKGFIDTMRMVNEKLSSADAIVGELLIDSTAELKLGSQMLLKNTFLNEVLNEKEYKLVDDYVKKVSGYDLSLFNSMKPAAVQIILMQFIAPKTFTDSNPALDQYIQAYAKTNHKKIIGLETVEDQANLLFGSSIERQKELLLKSVEEEEKNKKESRLLYENYITQNLEELAKLFTELDGYTQEELDQLLKNRNTKWIAQLPNLMENQSLFIAVGAGHLLGNDGLIKGLRKLGYAVKPLATN